MDFKKLKDQTESGKTLKETVWFSSEKDQLHKKGSKLADRITDSLAGSDIGAQIRNCAFITRDKIDSVCGSIFCAACREKRQNSMYAAFQKQRDEKYGDDEDKARENLRWMTVLHSVESVSFESPTAEIESCHRISAAVSDMRERITKVGRTAQSRFYEKEIWMRGAIHLELLDIDLYRFAGLAGGLTKKEQTLQEFIGVDGPSGGKAILVHFHALIDLAGIDDDHYKSLFSEYWNFTSRQTLSTRTWTTVNGKDQSLDNGLLAMARYCFNWSNANLRFNRNWGGGEKVLEYGEKVDERRITLGYAKEMLDRSIDGSSLLSKGDIRMLVNVHQHVSGKSGKGLLVAIY